MQDVLRAARNTEVDEKFFLGDKLKAALANSDEDTFVLICGSSNGMGKEVQEALIAGELIEVAQINAMKASGNYIMELWGE